MKVTRKTAIVATVLAATVGMMVASCDALWDTSVGVDAGYPGYYGSGIDSYWYPSLPGAPLLSPVYWGGQLYPGGVLPPLHPTRPGGIGPVYGPIYNGSSGNVRPGGRPVTLPEHPVTPPSNVRPSRPGNSVLPPAGTFNPGSVTGGQPGIAMPPANSGYRPGRH